MPAWVAAQCRLEVHHKANSANDLLFILNITARCMAKGPGSLSSVTLLSRFGWDLGSAWSTARNMILNIDMLGGPAQLAK